MITKFVNSFDNAKGNAQYNLAGRTHYVDDATLKFHKSRILKTVIAGDGLLFGLIESYAADMHNTKRLFRAVVFDVFGTVVERKSLSGGATTRAKAELHLSEMLDSIDAKKHTQKAITAHRKRVMRELTSLKSDLLGA